MCNVHIYDYGSVFGGIKVNTKQEKQKKTLFSNLHLGARSQPAGLQGSRSCPLILELFLCLLLTNALPCLLLTNALPLFIVDRYSSFVYVLLTNALPLFILDWRSFLYCLLLIMVPPLFANCLLSKKSSLVNQQRSCSRVLDLLLCLPFLTTYILSISLLILGILHS